MDAEVKSANNKRIAKNTLLLYVRMIVTTIVSLYTVRLVLKLLGVQDYGIFSVVAGIIEFTTIITATMTSATQRFLAFDLGKGDLKQYVRTYSMLINIFILFCIVAVILLEIIGPYCIQHYLVIPADRMFAAQWLFQCVIINFVVVTMNIPQTSSIIAYEKMDVYAYFTFLDVFFKLGAVAALTFTPIDRLITYGITTTLFQIVTNGIILFYALKKLEGCRIIRYWNTSLFKKMLGYSGWNLFGSLSGVLVIQGQSIIVNIFFGPVVNGAKAIGDRINNIITSFSNNFYMAVSPQIIKTYAAGEIDYTRKLVLSTSKYSFFLLAVLSFPLIFNMEPLLQLWLGKEIVSVEMVRFSQLELVSSMVMVLEAPITMAVRATGDIKKYQIVVGVQTLMFLPICYLAFMAGLPAYSSMIILSVLYFIVQFFRVYLVKDIIRTSLCEYIKTILLPIFCVSGAIILLGNVFAKCFNTDIPLLTVGINSIVIILLCLFIVGFVGLNKQERACLYNIIRKRIKK